MSAQTMRTPFIALCFALAAAPMAAQDPDTARTAPADSGNNTILDITVDPAANERHVVFLQKGIVYRARFSESGATLRMRSLGNKQLPFVVDLGDGDASGGTELEIYPQADGDIELSVLLPASVPVRFRLWSDARATERGRRSAEEGYWELGVDGLAGWHGGYGPTGSEGGAAGVTYGGCLTVRNGPGPLGLINGCIAGAEGMTGGGGHNYLGLFTEPHLRLSNGRRTDQGWRYEWGALARLEIYSGGSDGNFGSTVHGYGVYLARDQRDLTGRGWRLTLAARGDRIKTYEYDGFGAVTSTDNKWVPALQLQVGRYR